MSTKVGRPTISEEGFGLYRSMQLPVCLVTATPIIPKNAKRTYFDGHKLHRLVNVRTTVSFFYKNNLKEVLKELKKDGMKNLRYKPLILDMPKFCLKCDKKGNPSYGRDKVKSEQDQNFKDDLPRFRLWYTHYKVKKPCYVGYWNGGVKLAKGIDIRKMGAVYQSLLHIKGNQIK